MIACVFNWSFWIIDRFIYDSCELHLLIKKVEMFEADISTWDHAVTFKTSKNHFWRRKYFKKPGPIDETPSVFVFIRKSMPFQQSYYLTAFIRIYCEILINFYIQAHCKSEFIRITNPIFLPQLRIRISGILKLWLELTVKYYLVFSRNNLVKHLLYLLSLFQD